MVVHARTRLDAQVQHLDGLCNVCYDSVDADFKWHVSFNVATLFLQNLIIKKSIISCWIIHGLSAIVFVVLLPITWFNKLWLIFRSMEDEEPEAVRQPKNSIIKWLFLLSRNIIHNAMVRIAIYLTVVFLLSMNSIVCLVRCFNITHLRLIIFFYFSCILRKLMN